MRIGSLGDIIFEVSAEKVLTPSEFSREHTARYEQHNVLGALPRLEFLSADLESTTLPIRLRADMGINPAKEAEKLSVLCKEGKVVRLILAGYSMGNVVIESMSQTWRLLAPSGKGSYLLDISLKLKEYV